jgi:hypothetical protein
MNIVRAQRRGQLGFGQYDPSTGIVADLQLGPQDTAPNYNDPNIILPGTALDVWTPTSATIPVPQPGPGVTLQPPVGFTLPTGTIQSLYPQGVPSPAPRVNIPLSTASGFLSSSVAGIPMIAVLGIGLVGLLALSGGKGGRR